MTRSNEKHVLDLFVCELKQKKLNWVAFKEQRKRSEESLQKLPIFSEQDFTHSFLHTLCYIH